LKGGYIILNGRFYRENEPVFSGIDLGRLSNGVTESLRAENNLVLFAEANYNFLINSLKSIHLPPPNDWTLSRFASDISRLLNKNHFYLAAKVNVQFFPGPTGTDYLLTSEELQRGFYPVNDTVLLMDFYRDGSKTSTANFAFEPANRFLWTAAKRVAQNLSKHNLILLNHEDWACETIGGSFGYIKEGMAIFPSPRLQGYRPPIMGVVIECARQSGLKILQKTDIGRDDLIHADELFLIDNCLGVQLILGLGSERYYTTKSTSIALKLNEIAQKDLT
jgi:branched-subunit amino acid aminotransferase/4-amino-4-deoxychorismate lyase